DRRDPPVQADLMKDDPETRERLINAAERMFAERGVKKVTVREICRAAHANVAAVNYHFGGKLGLYREARQLAIDAMRERTARARLAGASQPPEEKLRRYIAIFLRRLVAPGHACIHRILNREINDPTPALDALVEQGVRPRVAYLAGIVAEIVGGKPSD